MNFLEILKNISLYSSITTIVLGCICLTLYLTKLKESSVFCKYLILCALTDILSLYGTYSKTDTLMLIPFFSFFELFFFVNYFKSQFAEKKLNILIFASAALAVADTLLIHYKPTGSVFVVSRVCNSIFLILLAFYSIYYFQLPKRFVRINFAIILYFSLTFVHFLLLNLLINVKEQEIFLIWITYSLACVFFNFLLFFDVWKFGKIHKL